MNFSCRSCGSKNIREILDLGEQPWGNDFIKIKKNEVSQKYPLKFVICENCKMSQINYTVPKEKMFRSHSYMSGTTKTLSLHFFQYFRSDFRKISYKRKFLHPRHWRK